MNAAVMAHGLTAGGRKGAREALEEFWHGVARISAPFGALQLFEVVSRFLSPYQLNPFKLQPAAPAHPTSHRFRAAEALFLSATNVRTGKIKVFSKIGAIRTCWLYCPDWCFSARVRSSRCFRRH